MSSSSVDQAKMYLMGTLILEFIGTIIIFAANYVGVWAGAYYYEGAFSDTLESILMTLAGFLLLITALFSIMGLAKPDIVTKKNILVILGLLGLSLLLSVIVIASLAITVDYEWWPEAGLYAGIVAPLLSLALTFLIYKEL
ncbi:MAG: hypothetical protein ACFFAS_06230 [Promethearchaeota archaeon]